MSEALVSFLVEQLGSIIFQQVEQNVRLVVNVKKEVATLTLNLETIQAVLADAERRQVKEANVRRWLNNLKEVSYEIDNVVDEWSIEILKKQIEKQGENAVVPKKKVCFSIPFHCLCNGQVTQIIFRRDIAVRIKELNEKLALIHEQRKFYKFLENEIEFEQHERLKSFSIVDESEIFGRDYERNKLVSQLVSENSEERKKPLVISIVGMGGIGKTTLAQLAYNDVKVKNCFHTRIWVCVSDPFVQIAVAKAILESLKVTVPNSNELETFAQLIYDSIKGKKFLLVLDDVCDSNHRKWEPFLTTLHGGASGSRILVTTRIAQVASAMGTTNHRIFKDQLIELWICKMHDIGANERIELPSDEIKRCLLDGHKNCSKGELHPSIKVGGQASNSLDKAMDKSSCRLRVFLSSLQIYSAGFGGSSLKVVMAGFPKTGCPHPQEASSDHELSYD
ncbi:hypothetical protein ABKV19_008611 [Rosa sericea]